MINVKGRDTISIQVRAVVGLPEAALDGEIYIISNCIKQISILLLECYRVVLVRPASLHIPTVQISQQARHRNP